MGHEIMHGIAGIEKFHEGESEPMAVERRFRWDNQRRLAEPFWDTRDKFRLWDAGTNAERARGGAAGRALQLARGARAHKALH
jgi:hypothetical protein